MKYVYILIITLVLVSCSGGSDKSASQPTQTVKSATVIYYLDDIETGRDSPIQLSTTSQTLIAYSQNIEYQWLGAAGCKGSPVSGSKEFMVDQVNASCELHVYHSSECSLKTINYQANALVLAEEITSKCAHPVTVPNPSHWDAATIDCGNVTMGNDITIQSLPNSGACTIELIEPGFDREFSIETSLHSATIDWKIHQADTSYEIYYGTDTNASDEDIVESWQKKTVTVSNIRLDNLNENNYTLAFRAKYRNGLTSTLEHIGAFSTEQHHTKNYIFEGSSPNELFFKVLNEPNEKLIPNESRWVPIILSAGSAAHITSIKWSVVSGPNLILEPLGEGINITAQNELGNTTIQGSVTDSLGRTTTDTFSISITENPYPSAQLLRGRSDGRGVDLVITGDGYTEEMQSALLEQAQRVNQFVFDDLEEVASHSGLWNVWLIESISQTHNVFDGPSKLFTGSDFTASCDEIFFCPNAHTAFSQMLIAMPHFDTGYVQFNLPYIIGRAAYVTDNHNSYNYGITYTSSTSLISAHELGHSHAYLKDEYSQNGRNSGYGENVSYECNPQTVSWSHWIDDMDSVPGLDREPINDLEVGCFSKKNTALSAYIPTQMSLMNSGLRFGPVNTEQWVLKTWQKSRSHFNPLRHEFTIGDKNFIALTVAPPTPTLLWANTWYKDNTEVLKDTPIYVYIYEANSDSKYKIEARDSTGTVRKDADGVSSFSHTFN